MGAPQWENAYDICLSINGPSGSQSFSRGQASSASTTILKIQQNSGEARISIEHTIVSFFKLYSKRIVSSSNDSPKNVVDDVPNEVKGEFNNLKEAAEGDAKPERETTTQGAEHTSVLE